MNKSEQRELIKLEMWARVPYPDIGMLARAYSALIRSTDTNTSRNVIIVSAAQIPAIVQHPEFIL